jgi:hypothetical protein
MYNYSSIPKIEGCTFSNNSAGDGGGMYNMYYSSPTIIDCTFASNYGVYCGGMYNDHSSPILRGCVFSGNDSSYSAGGMTNISSSPKIEGCTLSRNATGRYGGGMENCEASSPTLTNCTFSGNSAEISGGGMRNYQYSSPTVEGCTFTGNLAKASGGAIHSGFDSGPTIINCTIGGNSAPNGPAMACELSKRYPSDVTISNCIIWNGPNWLWNADGSTIKATYSDIAGGWPGEGNIDTDPCFADSGYWDDPCNTPDESWDDVWTEGDYHLKSQAGRYDPNEGRWTIDDVTSPCIDAGDPMSPIMHEPFPNGGIINMGAYGGTAEASKSYFGTPPCETIVAGDINSDCAVDFKDFTFIALHWLTANTQ